jgi:hypothetical protein
LGGATLLPDISFSGVRENNLRREIENGQTGARQSFERQTNHSPQAIGTVLKGS